MRLRKKDNGVVVNVPDDHPYVTSGEWDQVDKPKTTTRKKQEG